MKTSLMMTTYNSPAWLGKVLVGCACQSLPADEIIIADDGSSDDTAEVISRAAQDLALPLVHIWQPDQGFRKCQALNRAVAAAHGDYCIFTDADCIPHRDFIAWHVCLARPGRFLSGGYNKLSLATSQALSDDDIRTGRHCDPAWLAANGSPDLARERKLRLLGTRRGRLCDALTTTRASWNGHNASTWRRYILAANGFDHRMCYGGQDREFGERLENAGIRGHQIRHRATCVHLDHGRSYATPDSIAANRAIRDETRRQGLTRCAAGIGELVGDEGTITVHRRE